MIRLYVSSRGEDGERVRSQRIDRSMLNRVIGMVKGSIFVEDNS